MNKISLIGIDLAKSVFHVLAVDANGEEVLRRKFRRNQLLEWLAQTPPCTVAMEACGGAHYWAQACIRHGHLPKLIAPQFVKPYVKSNKNDFADTEAIVEAASRPTMRFVTVKDSGQLVLQALHRVRSQLVGQRTALSNQLRGILGEFGIAIGRGKAALNRQVPLVMADAENGLPDRLRSLLDERLAEWRHIDSEVKRYEQELKTLADTDPRCQRLMTIPGIGPLTASALVAAIPDASVFANGRALAAWLGLVPKHSGTGGKVKVLRISKRGDTYLRTLLIHGARSVVNRAAGKTDRRQRWVHQLAQRKGRNVAAVALANRNARTVWALLYHGTDYRALPAV